MKKYNSIDGRIHTNSRLWFIIRMAIKKWRNAEKELKRKYG
ncbi:hypothetical protein [Erysipelatoclostridium sp. DFI.2.3]|jgi:hypothetical protein|nr:MULTISPECIES: hypothetical protein [Thomasclavelia]